MLTLLNLTKIAPGADLLLLSAMMKNTAEIAGWIASLTGRHCLTLDLAWKPTRQVRACVVYPADQIEVLNAKLLQARRERPKQKSVPAGVKRELLAHPFISEHGANAARTHRSHYVVEKIGFEVVRFAP